MAVIRALHEPLIERTDKGYTVPTVTAAQGISRSEEVLLTVEGSDGWASVWLQPSEARNLALALLATPIVAESIAADIRYRAAMGDI